MSERGAENGRRLRLWAVASLPAVAAALLSTFGFFYFRDNFSTHYPFKFVSAAAWRAGAIPWWNLADGGGQPLAGNPNTLTFYPDNVLYLLFPVHVAFNLHFLLHLVLGWFAMRSLIRDASGRVDHGDRKKAALFGATLWVLSGAAMSALAFYNLATGIALIPFALWAAQHRSPLIYGGAFGLLILGTEPVTVVATAMVAAIVAYDRNFVRRSAVAIVVAAIVALPQIVAYSEIAREVERAVGYSAQTVLNASFDPWRLLELLAGPFLRIETPHLFPSLFLGLIVIPAVVRRSRWTVVVAVMLFFALGRFNPLIRVAIENLPSLRVARYPEKFALPLCAALVVLAALFFERTKARRLWLAITFLPLLGWSVATIPLDWWSPYALPAQPSARVHIDASPSGREPSRETYREFARGRQPLFGVTTGLRYVITRSGDGMHSTLSRIVAERYAATHEPRYVAIAAGLPMAMFVPRAVGAASVNQAVDLLERTPFDIRSAVIAPAALDGFRSSPGARVTFYREWPDRIEIGVEAPGDALLFVNQSYFHAWDGGTLSRIPLDIDRLGVMVPAGTKTVTLRFGQHRTLVVAAWVISSALILAMLLALRIEKRDGRAGQIERPADEDHSR